MVAVTPKAQEKLKEVLQSNGSPDALVRVAVIRGPHGCVHGWKLAIEDAQQPEDSLIRASGIGLLVEPELGEMLDGANIDYREDASGIGFTIDAPNTPAHGHGHGHDGGCNHH